ncbi:MAG: Gfo/Idh/MocA family oxidoreductase [Verrucomicrobiae bacterium]|nr:Gfo/Idh/MocA family oxidoreductase [Verrucomicrobiae bacterium]
MIPSRTIIVCVGLIGAVSVVASTNMAPAKFKLITLDPGHFHAALVQKFMYPDVDPVVHVYAPFGEDLIEHLRRIERFNTRTGNPTDWRLRIYIGPDFLDRMLAEKPGNVVVLSGNNAKKTQYILKSVQAGLNVLADKPMAITPADFQLLKQAFAVAESNRVLIYDIMTERFEITSILQRELAQQPELFGQLLKGTPDDPAIVKESVHHFSKVVAGAQLKRPQWFFDVRQQGEAIVDVSTHLVDLIQWQAFPEQALDPSDANVLRARRWTTPLTREQFKKVTGADDFPDYLRQDVKGGILHVYANGEFTYTLRGVHARVCVKWAFEAPPGGGDTHFSVLRGTNARLVIRQAAEQKYKPVLYIEKATNEPDAAFERVVARAIEKLQTKYPGVGFEREKAGVWRVTIPAKYAVGHEEHFAQVTENFLRYLRAGRLPHWEVPNMLTKYATLMQAYELSR